MNSWKLSRDKRGLTNDSHRRINDTMKSVPVLRQDYFEEMSQTDEDCFVYPPLTNGMVYLKGQCPNAEDIDTVPDFNSDLVSYVFLNSNKKFLLIAYIFDYRISIAI